MRDVVYRGKSDQQSRSQYATTGNSSSNPAEALDNIPRPQLQPMMVMATLLLMLLQYNQTEPNLRMLSFPAISASLIALMRISTTSPTGRSRMWLLLMLMMDRANLRSLLKITTSEALSDEDAADVTQGIVSQHQQQQLVQ